MQKAIKQERKAARKMGKVEAVPQILSWEDEELSGSQWVKWNNKINKYIKQGGAGKYHVTKGSKIFGNKTAKIENRARKAALRQGDKRWDENHYW